RRFILPVLAAGVLLTLCALPLTGWLVRNQFMVVAGGGLAAFSRQNPGEVPVRKMEAVLRAHPNDFQLHLGAALLTAPANPDAGDEAEKGNRAQWQALQKLLPQFAGQPLLYAMLLNSVPGEKLGVPETSADKGEPWSPPANNAPWKPDADVDRGLLKQ